MAQPPQPPPEEGDTPGCVVKEIEKQLYKTLKDVFKYDSYKSLVQKRAVEAVSRSSHDVFVHMPTGAGKSLCYQLPAIVSERRGLTVVVSPLIALMLNQIKQMVALGIPTETINSKMSTSERERVRKDLTSNSPKTKLLYITPEFANTPGFISIMDRLYKSNNIARIAVDEAHCVSQWGQSFRPDYLQLSKLRERYMSIPWVALTATASVQVMDDVLALLKLSPPVAIFKTSCFRSNLYYDVVFKDTMDDPYSDLTEFAQSALGEEFKQGCGIVYCRTRDGCEELAGRLTKLGLRTLPYHAGIKPGVREETQTSWMDGKVPVIAATVSFGMGIDKSNVRFVAHWCVSQSVAGYYQESGRAGRDGKLAKCRIYYSRKDRDTILFLLKKDETTVKTKTAKIKVAATIKSFNTMIKYCEESLCRHYVLAREFGDDMPDCKKYCDVCRSPKSVEQKLSAFKGLALGSKIKYSKESGSADLYGGGRQGVKQEYAEYDGRDSVNQEKEAAIALSNLISEEFNKRKGSKDKTERYTKSNSHKVLQPSITKIPEVSVPMRENYYDKILEEVKYHLKACSSNKHCPTFNEKDFKQCASEFEWQCFSSKKNIHMYRREIVNLTKSLREASRQVEIHPLVSNFVPGQNSSGKSNSGDKKHLHTIVDYFSKQKSSNERFESTNLSNSQSGCDSHKTRHGSDVSQGNKQTISRSRSSDTTYCDGSDKNKSSVNLDSDTDNSEKCSPKKRKRMSDSSKSSIEEKKPIMKYFFESVGCPVEESRLPPLSIEMGKSIKSGKSVSPNAKSCVDTHDNKPLVSPQKKKRRKSSDLFSDKSGSTEKSKSKNDHAKTTTQIRNDNLKKAADLVRKHLNPEYKSKRISKDFFKIVCRSISHRLVESDAVNDTAAKFEVEKLLQSNGSLHVNQ